MINFHEKVCSNLFSNSNCLLKMTCCYIEMHGNKFATHFPDCIANLEKCDIAFSNMILDKSDPGCDQRHYSGSLVKSHT